MTRLHHSIERWASETPDAPALWWQGRCWTYAELWADIVRLAASLTAAVPAGGRVAVIADNHPDLVSLMYAAPAAGRALLLVNTRLTPNEQRRILDDVEPELVIGTTEDGLDLGALRSAGSAASTIPEPGRHRDPDADLAWIIHTSGTTGRPKGARLTHASLLAAVAATSVGRPFAADDVYLFPFPLFHVAAYNVLHAHARGLPVVLEPKFTADGVLEAAERHRVTAMSLAPTMISMFLDHPGRTSRSLAGLRTLAYGASAIPLDALLRTLDELDCDIAQGYGMTELSGNAVFLDGAAHRRAATDEPRLLAAAGVAGPGVELRLVDDESRPVRSGDAGEIVIRSAQVCDGYWRAPEATAETFVDGWLHTGDIGRLEGGVLYVVDRKKDLVISGGENVSSREVEDAVSAHPDVGSVVVVGVPDERWGERVVAVVVPAPGCVIDPNELVEWCRGRLAGFKRPKQVLVRHDFPLGASGKVLKREVREWAVAQAGDTS